MSLEDEMRQPALVRCSLIAKPAWPPPTTSVSTSISNLWGADQVLLGYGWTRTRSDEPIDNCVEYVVAAQHLVCGDKFVRFVRLLDRAGAADDRWDA